MVSLCLFASLTNSYFRLASATRWPMCCAEQTAAPTTVAAPRGQLFLVVIAGFAEGHSKLNSHNWPSSPSSCPSLGGLGIVVCAFETGARRNNVLGASQLKRRVCLSWLAFGLAPLQPRPDHFARLFVCVCLYQHLKLEISPGWLTAGERASKSAS